ncbi:MAG TPA: AIM24 family protein [Acidimicrobiales bacterium]|nr:AIM24 family protein [Acidimicrobiales bacterium]
MPPPGTAVYTCPYCRMPSDTIDLTCPHCGAPADVREHVSDSGWAEQPAIRDMARLHFSRSTCQISGKYVPVADFGLDEQDSVYFSHHVLLHMSPTVRMEAMAMAGGWNRMLAGMPLVMMRAAGPGHIAFSHDDPGETVAVPLPANQSIEVAEHRFLVATGNVVYGWQASGIWYTTQSGDDQETHYPMGMMLDRFTAQAAPGLLLLHSPGNVFIRDLAPGQSILIQPSALLYKDLSVQMRLHFEYPGGAYWFSSARMQTKTTWLTLYGPGRVAIQSVFRRPEMVGYVTSSSGATQQRW